MTRSKGVFGRLGVQSGFVAVGKRLGMWTKMRLCFSVVWWLVAAKRERERERERERVRTRVCVIKERGKDEKPARSA